MNFNTLNTKQYEYDRSIIPYLGMSEGQLDLAIKRDRAHILRSYYGDPHGAHSKAIELINNALYNNDYNRSGFTGVIHDDAQWAAHSIANANLKRKIVGFQCDNKVAIAGNFSLISNRDFGEWITNITIRINQEGNRRITSELLTRFQNGTDDSLGQIIYDFGVRNFGPFTIRGTNWLTYVEGYRNYITGIATIVSQDWVNQGHHVMYEWLGESGVARVSPRAIAKENDHRNGFDLISRDGLIPRQLLRDWTENGLMQCNVDVGNQPFNGRQSVEILAQTNFLQDGQGFAPNLFTIPGAQGQLQQATRDRALLIITGIATALTVALEIIDKISLAQQIEDYGLPSGQPEPSDWPFPGMTNDGVQESSFGTIGLLALLGGGALLFSQLNENNDSDVN